MINPLLAFQGYGSTGYPTNITSSSTYSFSASSLVSWPFVLIMAIIAVIIGFGVAKYLSRSKKFSVRKGASKSVLTFSLLISILAALYLLMFDTQIQAYGAIHWAGLLAFTMVNIILLVLYLFYEKQNNYFLAIWSILGVIVILLDAFLALPLSQYSTGIGTSTGLTYLFGFGAAGTSSTFAISLAVTLLLVSLFVSFLYSIHNVYNRKK